MVKAKRTGAGYSSFICTVMRLFSLRTYRGAEALKIGKTVPDMLKADLALENIQGSNGELKKAIAASEKAQDYVTRDMLAIQLEDTEMDHAYFLEKQVRLIEPVGLPNYLQSQMGCLKTV